MKIKCKDESELQAAIAANTGCHVRRYADGTGEVLTGADAPKSAVAQAVTPRQIRLALTATGLRTMVENAVKAGSQDLKDWWEYALEIERHHPMIEAMGAQLGQTPEQIDALFNLAGTL